MCGFLPMSSSPLGINSGVNAAAWQGQSQDARLQQLQRDFANPSDTDHKKLKKSAQDFEAVFLHQLIEQMDKTVDRENSIMGGGSAEDYWRGMMNEQVAQSMATQPGGSGMGLAESIYKQMATQLPPDADSQANIEATAINPLGTNAGITLTPKATPLKSLIAPEPVDTSLAPKIRKL
jgi:Rod binding domain-containing protein